jgi:hypothetical protein
MRSLALAVILVLSSAYTFADDGEHTFSLRVSGQGIDGPEPVDLNSSDQVFNEIANGAVADVDLTWRPAPLWRLAVGHERASVRYVDPQLEGCALSVGSVAGIDFCQAIGFLPQGTIRDETRHWHVVLGRLIALNEHWSIDVSLGYGQLAWWSEDDREASTFSTCLTQGIPGWTRRAPDCVPVDDRARASGWTVGLAARWQPVPRLGLAVGANGQRYRHDIYRYDALQRFLAAQPRPCNPFNYCDWRPDQFIGGRTVQRGDWWWYTAAVDFAISPTWSVIAEGEFGGSRDWRTAGLALEYRW